MVCTHKGRKDGDRRVALPLRSQHPPFYGAVEWALIRTYINMTRAKFQLVHIWFVLSYVVGHLDTFLSLASEGIKYVEHPEGIFEQ